MDTHIVSLIKKICNQVDANPPKKIMDGDGLLCTIPLSGDRSQLIMILTVEGGKYLRFVSPIGRYRNLNADKILEQNLQLTNGAFAKCEFDLYDGLGSAPTLALVDCQRIDTADYEEIEDKLINIATLADKVEEQIYGSDRT